MLTSTLKDFEKQVCIAMVNLWKAKCSLAVRRPLEKFN